MTTMNDMNDMNDTNDMTAEQMLSRREQLEEMTGKELRAEYEKVVGAKAPPKTKSADLVSVILQAQIPQDAASHVERVEDDKPMVFEQPAVTPVPVDPKFWGRPTSWLHIAAVLLLASEVTGGGLSDSLASAHDALEAAVPAESDGVKYEDRFQPQFERLLESLSTNPIELAEGGLHAEVGQLAQAEWDRRQAEIAAAPRTAPPAGATGAAKTRKAATPPKPIVDLTPELQALAEKAKVSRIPAPGGQQSAHQMIATEMTRDQLGDGAFATPEGLLVFARLYLEMKADVKLFVQMRDHTEIGKACQAAFQGMTDARRYWKPVAGEGRVAYGDSEKRLYAKVG